MASPSRFHAGGRVFLLRHRLEFYNHSMAGEAIEEVTLDPEQTR
jgi:hypothetical protein